MNDKHYSWNLLPLNFDSFEQVFLSCNALIDGFAFTPSALLESPRWLIFFSDAITSHATLPLSLEQDNALAASDQFIDESVIPFHDALPYLNKSSIIAIFNLNLNPSSPTSPVKRKMLEDHMLIESFDKRLKLTIDLSIFEEAREAAFIKLPKAP